MNVLCARARANSGWLYDMHAYMTCVFCVCNVF